ncbi:MAG: hypothetical protein AB4041_16635 [Microcystaceae cyanobacterium]
MSKSMLNLLKAVPVVVGIAFVTSQSAIATFNLKESLSSELQNVKSTPWMDTTLRNFIQPNHPTAGFPDRP